MPLHTCIYSEIYANLEQRLTATAHLVLELVPLLQHVSIQYIPQIGYLVAINEADIPFLTATTTTTTANTQNYLNSQNYDPYIPVNEQIGHNSDPFSSSSEEFKYVFNQNNTYYYKHKLVYDLDDNVGDIKNMILDRQKELLLQIEDILLSYEVYIHPLSTILATIDVIVALGTVSKELQFTRPTVLPTSSTSTTTSTTHSNTTHNNSTNNTAHNSSNATHSNSTAHNNSSNTQLQHNNSIIIKNGRHPLQELTVDSFIPNDTYITYDKNIAIITGTVYICIGVYEYVAYTLIYTNTHAHTHSHHLLYIICSNHIYMYIYLSHI